MKIAFFEIEDWEKDYVKEKLPGFELKFFNDELKEEHISEIQDCEVIAVFIYSKVDAETINKLPNLKLVTTMSTGFDHIDIGECAKKNIVACNVPFYGENTVAEHTMALMLAMSRKIVPSVERTKRGDFNLKGLRGFDLKEKKLGVIGGGHIGMHVVKAARGLGMDVIVFDPFPKKELEQDYGFMYVNLDDLFAQADIITLHAPLNEHTKHIINKGNINKIKKGAYLVNTARGGLIETEALIEALNQGIIAGAALDVLEEEFLIKEEKQLLSKNFPEEGKDLKMVLEEHALLEQDNVIITPHNAFNSNEALLRIVDTTIENIKKFLENNPQNVVVKK